MHVAVVPLPSMLPPDSLAGRSVVVFDVLRATTTIAGALAAGATEVRAFPSLNAAREAWAAFVAPKLLAGERQCVRPPGFDVGNSPLEMTPAAVAGRTIFMSTTNGTRAMRAACDHPTLLRGGAGGTDGSCFAAALVNVAATARQLARERRDVVLLCAGSDGELAEEDLIGAGALLAALAEAGVEVARTDDAGAVELFDRFRREGVGLLRHSRGGQKLIAAGMPEDIDACARVDAVPVACRADAQLRIRPVEIDGT